MRLGSLTVAGRFTLSNIIFLLMMLIGFVFFGDYTDRFINNEVGVLQNQAQLMASTIATIAVDGTENGEVLRTDSVRQIIRRLVGVNDARTQIFSTGSILIADSKFLMGGGRYVQIERLPPPHSRGNFLIDGQEMLKKIVEFFPYKRSLPVYDEKSMPDIGQLQDVRDALMGQRRWTLWRTPSAQLMLTVVVPIQRLNQVSGVVMVTRDSAQIAPAIVQLRMEALKSFLGVLLISTALSFYLAQTIARPLKKLASAARSARDLHGIKPEIPDYSKRSDEVGELSGALKSMTQNLWMRLDAIEKFSADVSHELKNPLASIDSALQTIERVKDPDKIHQLLEIITFDVKRMERLIADISAMSRLDAELMRAAPEIVDLCNLVHTLVQTNLKYEERVRFTYEPGSYVVHGLPHRLAQVVENLLSNALSYSPASSIVELSMSGDKKRIYIYVDDFGPGISESKVQKIFERFYTTRSGEGDFGQHSGLGLSICRQIVEGIGGKITCENRIIPTSGKVEGARFCVVLPRATV